jgi:hypothetical protein
MVELETDKKILKKMKIACESDESYAVVSLKSWHLLSPLFKNLSYNGSVSKPSYYLMFYLQCYMYQDFLSTFELTTTSFTVNSGVRFKHYALKYEYKDCVYHFSLSYNKDYGIELYFYPILNNVKVVASTDSSSLREYAPMLYRFSAELYENVLTYLWSTYTLDQFKSHLAIKDKYIVQDKASNKFIEKVYMSKDFSLIMPPLE